MIRVLTMVGKSASSMTSLGIDFLLGQKIAQLSPAAIGPDQSDHADLSTNSRRLRATLAAPPG